MTYWNGCVAFGTVTAMQRHNKGYFPFLRRATSSK